MQIKRCKKFIKKLPINKSGEEHVVLNYNKFNRLFLIEHINENGKLYCTYMPASITLFTKEDEQYYETMGIAGKVFEVAYYLNGEKSPNEEGVYKTRYSYDGSLDVKIGIDEEGAFEIRERKNHKQITYYGPLRLKKVVYYNYDNEIHRENGAAVTVFHGNGGISEEYRLNNNLICFHNSYYFRNKKLVKNETINFERLDDLQDAKAIYNLAKYFKCSKQFIDKIESSLVLLELDK